MNYIKCHTTLPEGKLFCPNCGHLNESGAHSKPISSSVYSVSGLRDNKLITAFADKSNSIALIGGLLVIFSFFLTFLEWPPVFNARGELVQASLKLIGRNTLLGDAISTFRLLQAGEIGLPIAVLNFVFMIVGWTILLGSAFIAFLALSKHIKTARASLIIGVCGLIFLIRHFLQDTFLTGPQRAIFGGGFYLLIVGVICLLISGGSIFFDEKSIKKEKGG